MRLAVYVSHPIQYQAPLYRRLASEAGLELHVLFQDRSASKGYFDAEFGQVVEWDVPLLSGYASSEVRSRATYLPARWRPIQRARSLLEAYGIDILWLHGYASVSALQFLVEARKLGIGVVVRAEMWDVMEYRSVTRRAKDMVLRRVFNRVDGFLAIGSANARYFADRSVAEARIYHVPYAVDNERFEREAVKSQGGRREMRSRLNIAEEAFVLVFVGKLIEKKRPEDLLACLARLRLRGMEVYAVFVGSGHMLASLERECDEQGISRFVRWTGFANQGELADYYAGADVLVLPSEFEPWGLVVNEALACGLPVVASDRVGSGVDLLGSGAGTVYPVGNIDAMALAVARYVDPETRRWAAERAREVIAAWGYEEDVVGIRACMESLRQRREDDSGTSRGRRRWKAS